MAIMYPKKIAENAPTSEKKLFERLKRLPGNYSVLHSVAWQSKRAGRESDGEADFIILAPDRGILIIEVKGGRIELSEGAWFSTDRNEIRNTIKDPFRQAVQSKHALIRFLKSHSIETSDFAVGHAVCFPDIQIDADIGPLAPRTIIWDRKDIEDVETALNTTFIHWDSKAQWPEDILSKILALIAPTLTVKQRLADDLSEITERLIRLTDEQVFQFQLLRRVKKAFVKGGAGTGKTLLAIERAKQLTSEGFSVALFCYNELLGKQLSGTLSNNIVYAGTFHSFAMKQMRKAKIPIPSASFNSWWEADAPELLAKAISINQNTFDCIIVDEAQDFHPSWIEVISKLQANPSDPFIYLFGDIHQALYNESWRIPEADFVPIELNINCRSTLEIAERASAVFSEPCNGLGINGPKPQYFPISNSRTTAFSVRDIVDILIESENIDPKKIIILSEDAEVTNRLLRLSAGEHPFVKDGQGITIETVRRYKGLEQEVVILILPENPQFAREIIYTGLSRAKLMLFVYAPQRLRKAINWD